MIDLEQVKKRVEGISPYWIGPPYLVSYKRQEEVEYLLTTIRELIEEVEGMKFPEIKGFNSLGEFSEFPTSKPAHESNEVFQQFFHNQALQKVVDYLKEGIKE